MTQDQDDTRTEFEQEAQAGRAGLAAEFLAFLAHNKKWWLLPILIVMLLTAVLVIIGGSGAAPFIYTLF